MTHMSRIVLLATLISGVASAVQAQVDSLQLCRDPRTGRYFQPEPGKDCPERIGKLFEARYTTPHAESLGDNWGAILILDDEGGLGAARLVDESEYEVRVVGLPERADARDAHVDLDADGVDDLIVHDEQESLQVFYDFDAEGDPLSEPHAKIGVSGPVELEAWTDGEADVLQICVDGDCLELSRMVRGEEPEAI